MNFSNTELADNASSQVSSELFCPDNPIHIWVLGERTMFKITAATTLVMSPVTILLNILVILAVRLSGKLKEHKSNILLASLAVADVLMGAISMPLTISLDVLVLLKQFLSEEVFCRIAFANEMVLNIGCTSSVYHLVVISWERYVAIRKWKDYKSIVTRERLKKYASIAWLIAVLKTIPLRFVRLTGVQYKYLTIISTVSFLPGFVCLILIVYFYIMVYLGVRKRNVETISDVRSIIKAKLASRVAKTTAILTVAVLASFVPSLILQFFGEAFPALRRSSYFRWSMMMAQLNSLFNPVLYCCRDRRYKDAIVEMLKMKKPANRVQKNVRRVGSGQSVAEVPENNHTPRSRIRSCASITDKGKTDQCSAHDQVKREKIMSAPSCETNRKICDDMHRITTRPIIQVKGNVTKKATRRHREDTNEMVFPRFQVSLRPHSSSLPAKGSDTHYRKTAKTETLDEAFEMNGGHHKCWKESIRRREREPPTTRGKKIPDGHLNFGFTREPGNKVKRGVKRNETRSYHENTEKKCHAKIQTSFDSRCLSLRSRDSRLHCHEMVRTKSLNERTLFEMIGSQHSSCQVRKPETAVPATLRNTQIAERELTTFTRNTGIKVASGVTKNGRRSRRLDTNYQLQALRSNASHPSPSLTPKPKGPKCSRNQFREMMTSTSLNERQSLGKIGFMQKPRQEAIKRPKTVPSTRRNKKMPEPENLTHGLIRELGIKVKNGVRRNVRRSHRLDTNDQLQASRLKASHQPQSSSPKAKDLRGSRYRDRGMMRLNSLDARALFEKIGIQHERWQEAMRRTKTAPSTTSKEMPNRDLTRDLTRKPGIQVKSYVIKRRRSHREDTSVRTWDSRIQASLQPQSRLLPRFSHCHDREMMRSNIINDRKLGWIMGIQHKYLHEAIKGTKTTTSRNKKMPESELKDFTSKKGIKTKTEVTRNGRQSCRDGTNDQLQSSRLHLSLQPQFLSARPKYSQDRHHDMIQSKSLNERSLPEMIDSQLKGQKEAIKRPETTLRTSTRKKIKTDRKLTGFTTKL